MSCVAPVRRWILAAAAMLAYACAADSAQAAERSELVSRASTSVVTVMTSEGELGSAFAFGAPGEYLTNQHVIEGGGEITLKTADGRTATAEVVNEGDEIDAALVRSELRLPALKERRDPLRPGDSVLAIGSPGALQGTVTAGIVSAVERDLAGGASVQMDVPISPGSSGGPILDEEGAVAAIATATRVDLQSVNYAVPIDDAASAVGAVGGGTAGTLPAAAALLFAGGLLAGAVVWLRGAGSRSAAQASSGVRTSAGPAATEEEPLVIVRRSQSPPASDVTLTKRRRREETWT